MGSNLRLSRPAMIDGYKVSMIESKLWYNEHGPKVAEVSDIFRSDIFRSDIFRSDIFRSDIFRSDLSEVNMGAVMIRWLLSLEIFLGTTVFGPMALLARELPHRLRQGGRAVSMIEPHMNIKVTYVGRPFNSVMDELFGVTWHKQDEVLLTCADGYQSSIAPEKFLSHKAWLVWERADHASFEVRNNLQGGELVKLGPYYLVWENENDAEIRAGGATDFPYQVVAIDLISFKERFPRLVPNKTAKPEIHDGFKYYRTYCMSCHAMNGEGGKKAPDLQDVGLFTRIKEAELRAWMLNPAKVKPGTLMPALAPQSPDRDVKATKIISYLKSKISK
jgi:cytochrome c2